MLRAFETLSHGYTIWVLRPSPHTLSSSLPCLSPGAWSLWPQRVAFRLTPSPPHKLTPTWLDVSCHWAPGSQHVASLSGPVSLFSPDAGRHGNLHGRTFRYFILWNITEGPTLKSSPSPICRSARVIPINLNQGQDSWWHECCLTLTLGSWRGHSLVHQEKSPPPGPW